MRFLCSLVAALAALASAAAQIESVPSAPTTDTGGTQRMPDSLDDIKKPAAPAANRTPNEIVETFFTALKADRVADAYGTLSAQFALQDRGNEASKMQDQTQKALDAYGPVVGWEMIKEEKLGTHLMRRTYILVGKGLPLRWKFYFYNSGEAWQLIDLRVDDALVEWFDDSKK